jgi:AhpD family alkylhydroperoxidase
MEAVGGRTLMWNPPLQKAQFSLVSGLRSASQIPARIREVAILRHAWRCGCDYQWAMHAEIGAREGLTDVEIAALAADDDSPWKPEEAAGPLRRPTARDAST